MSSHQSCPYLLPSAEKDTRHWTLPWLHQLIKPSLMDFAGLIHTWNGWLIVENAVLITDPASGHGACGGEQIQYQLAWDATASFAVCVATKPHLCEMGKGMGREHWLWLGRSMLCCLGSYAAIHNCLTCASMTRSRGTLVGCGNVHGGTQLSNVWRPCLRFHPWYLLISTQ